MAKFGIYIFNLTKDLGEIRSTDTMVGEVDMTSKQYEGMDVQEACEKRIKSELQAKNGLSFYEFDDVANLKCLKIDEEKNHVDARLRAYVCKHTKASPVKVHYNNTRKTTELLRDTSVEEVYRESKIYAGYETRARHSYGLREYQQTIVDKAAGILRSHKEVLINLSTRGGKSFVSLELARKMNAQNILILTPFPAAEGSFRSEIEEHKDFIGWTFYTRTDILKDTKFEPVMNCVFLSFQFTDPDLEKEKVDNLLSQVKFDVVVVDETHRMSASERSQKILEGIQHKYEIHLSGTPYNDLMSGRFSDENTVTLDFIDLIKWDKEHAGSKDAVNFPELSIKLVSNMKELNEKLVEYDPDAFEKDADFSFEKAFGDARDKTLAKPIAFAKWLFAQSIFDDYSHYLVFVPSVQVAKMFPEVLKKVQSKFAIMGLNDEDVSSNYEKQINDFEAKNKKTIIVTCAKCTTGVTLKRCDAIVLLKRLNSAETFVQTLFRCMTPFTGKTKAALFELDSEAAYKVVREVAAVHNALHAPKQTELDTYKELLDSVAIESWNGEKLEFQEELATSFLEKVKSIPTYYSMDEVFDLDDLTNVLTRNEQMTLLSSNFGKSDKAAAQYIVAQNENATGIKSKSYGKQQLDPTQKIADGNGKIEATKKSEKKLLDQVKKFLLNLDWEILLNDYTSFDQLYNYRAPEWTDDLQSIYRKILRANRKSVADFIQQYTEITLVKAKDDPDKMIELINKLSKLNDVDFRTPEVLVDKMLDKLGATKYDGTYILDPCCGTGTMLFRAMKRGWPKDHLIGTDIEPKFVNILNKLGFENVFVKNILDDDYEEFIENIVKENQMKIIANPPFYYPKPEGLRRTSGHLDADIWKKVRDAFANADMTFIMSHGCEFMKDMRYTAIDSEISFPNVGIATSIFSRITGDPVLDDKVNEESLKKADWLKDHLAKHSLRLLWEHDWDSIHYETGDPIPEGYVGVNNRSPSINPVLPGEVSKQSNGKPHKCVVLLKTSDPRRMKDWLLKEVQPQYKKFLSMFKLSPNIFRGFDRTVEVPEELIDEQWLERKLRG